MSGEEKMKKHGDNEYKTISGYMSAADRKYSAAVAAIVFDNLETGFRKIIDPIITCEVAKKVQAVCQQDVLKATDITSTMPHYMTVADAARRTGLRAQYLYRLYYAGRLVGVKVGRRLLIPVSAVRNLESGMVR
jgi:excisionase family DNA binding protein